MKKLVSFLVVVALLVPLLVPVSKAEAGAPTDIALGLASFAVFELVVRPLFAPRPAAAVVAAPPVPTTAVYAQPAVYSAPAVTAARPAGLTLANGASFPIDVFINGQLAKEGLQAGEVMNLGVVGSGLLLARTAAPEGAKFVERTFSVTNGGQQVILRSGDFR